MTIVQMLVKNIDERTRLLPEESYIRVLEELLDEVEARLQAKRDERRDRAED